MSMQERTMQDLFGQVLGGGGGGEAGFGKGFKEALEFVERHLVPMTQAQAAGLTLLTIVGGKDQRYKPIIDAVLEYRSLTGDASQIIRAIEAIALYNKFGGITASYNRERRV